MAQNYTRQSSFADGDTITAALFNNEFNQVVNAFAYSASSDSSTGHKHDGTSGQGGNIPQIGDIDFLNKIVVDNTNNRWGFYVQVSSGTVEQLRIQDGAIVPVTNNDIDLGTSSLEFKDLFIDGTAHIDTLDVDVNATVAGTLGVTGATTLSSDLSVGGNLTVTGNATIAGNLTFGDAATDTVAFSADVASNLLPSADNTYDLGASGSEWKDLYIDGTANIDSLIADTADINGGTVDSAIIGGTTPAAITGTAITATGIMTATGTSVFASLDISGDIDVDGTANLDIVDIDGAVNIAAATTIATDNKIQFRDTAIYVNSSTDGQLDIVADTEVQIAATTVDINGAVDISGNLDVGGNLVVTGTTTFNGGTLTLGDAASDNVVFGADVNSNIIPNTDSAFDLGSSTQEWRDLYLDGTAHIDTLDVDVNATIAGTLGVTGVLTGSSLDISGDIDVDGTTNLDVVDIDGAVDMASTLQVDGVITTDGYISVEGTSGNTGAAGDRWIGGDGTAGTWFYNVPTGSNHYFGVNNANKMAINTSGIDVTGTVTASSTLTAQKLVSTNGVLELDDNGTHNGIINSPASLIINIDSNANSTGEDFIIAKDRTSTSGGTELFRVQEDGSVGIGTTDPATYGGLALQQSSNTSSKGLAIVDSTAAQSVKLWVDGTNSYLSSGNTGADPLVLNLGGGNVGIGTSTNESGYKLDVRGWGQFEHPSGDCVVAIRTGNNTGSSFLYFGDQADINAAYVGYNHTSNDMSFVTNTSLAMTIDSLGGITGTSQAGGHVVFNEGGVNSDFRVESDGNANMLFVDGGANRVGVGVGAPEAALHIGAAANGSGIGFYIDTNTRTTGETYFYLGRDVAPNLTIDTSENITFNGSTVFNEASAAVDFRVESNGNANMLFVDGSANRVGVGISPTETLHVNGRSRIQNLYLGEISSNFDIVQATSSAGLYLVGGGSDVTIGTTGFIFNEGGVDADFRVESNNDAYALFVDGGNDRVVVGSAGTDHLNSKFVVVGRQTIANGSSANGSVLLTDGYAAATNDHLFNLGTQRSSGGPFISYGLGQNGSAADWVSTYDNFSGSHSVLTFNGSTLEYYFDVSNSQTTVGDAVAVKNGYKVGRSGTIFNDDGYSEFDFRVESDNNANMLFVDGGNDQVIIGASSGLNPSDAGLYARDGLIVGNFSGSGNGFTVYRGSGLNTNINHDSTKGFLTTSGIPLHFRTSLDTNYKISMETDGVVINEAGADYDFRVETDATSDGFVVNGSGTVCIGRANAWAFSSNTTPGFAVNVTTGRVDVSADSVARITQINDATGVFDRFYRAGSIVGSISTDGTNTAFNTSSDQRLKDNIVDAPSASDDIDAIQVRSFDWKANGSHQKYGMVAQELQVVAPDAVSAPEDPDEMMGVDYSKLVPMLIKEIQSLRARVADLES